MNTEQMLEVVDRQLKAYNGHDLNNFCACYHTEVTVNFLISGKTDSKGIKEFTEGYRELFENNPELKCELKSRKTLPDSVIDEELVMGLTGCPNGLHAVAIYGFRDGLIDRVWFAL